MSDIDIRVVGRAGRITLNRPDALNALTYEMCLAIERALDIWVADDAVALVVIDAIGPRAFCVGGDIAELYERGTKGDYAFGETFWADEYRLNHKIYNYPKSIVSFLQGFTLGGGVGVGCHGSHRIVGNSSQIAMPECGIGLIPDVGASLMLAQAPGRLGEYLGVTGKRMDAGNAIFAGFADGYIPELMWDDLIAQLGETGDASSVERAYKPRPSPTLEPKLAAINILFAKGDLDDVLTRLRKDESAFAKDTLKAILRNSPLSMDCTLELLRRLRGPDLSLEKALELEYRFTTRAMEHGDLLEGIRAAIIDKDRTPKWQYADFEVPPGPVERMLHPMGENALNLQGDKT